MGRCGRHSRRLRRGMTPTPWRGGILFSLLSIASLGLGCGGGSPSETAVSTARTEGAAGPAAAIREPRSTEAVGHATASTGGSIQGHTRPPTPAVNVSREGSTLSIRFRFPPRENRGEPKPWLLLTSVDSAGSGVPPLTLRTPVNTRPSGMIRRPLGAGSPPFDLVIATLADNGLRSRLIRIPLAE